MPGGGASGVTLSTEQTRRLQQALIAQGFEIPAGATGRYGGQTTAAVAAFQRAQGWTGSGADGIAGAETLRRLGVDGSSGSVGGRGRSAEIQTVNDATSEAAPAKERVEAPSKGGSDRSWDPQDARLVYDLQGVLISRGFSIPAGQTGYFGVRTQQAVADFQRSLGWSGDQADGIPGSQTLRRLGL